MPPETKPQFIHIRRALGALPWAILPEVFDAIVEVVERRASGVRLSAEEIALAIDAGRRLPPASATTAPAGIAVLPVFGVLSHRMYLMNDVSSSGTSAEALQRAFAALVENPDVGSIVLDVDSPGGSSAGIAELADAIFSARERKTIVAVANSLAASAAYWLASQAHELVVTPSGFVGSIGVFTYHDDLSGHLEQLGVKRTWIHAGKHKVEGNPTEPLSDDARAYEQQLVDGVYDAFTAAVARGRRVSKATARGEAFGEGRVLDAGAALAAGLVDRIETLDQTLQRLASRHAAAAKSRASTERDKRRVRLAELGA